MSESKLKLIVPVHEDLEASDDTPKAGDWLEHKVTETIWHDEDEFDDYPQHYNDSDGPIISIEETEDDEGYKEKVVTRWIFCAVIHVGSNYLELQDLRKNTYRVHLDDWTQECRPVVDPEARIQQSVRYWQERLTNATNKISALMQSVGVEGRQLAPDTKAVAVRVGTGPAEEHKQALVEVKEQLPELYRQIEKAGEEMGKWMSARALPLQVMKQSLNDRQTSIDRRLLAVDLYTGLSEEAVLVKRGKAASFGEKLHLIQSLHYMDEECLANYRHGGMDFRGIKKFDRWLAKKENFKRLFPYPRCAVAFRVRRIRRERHGESFADFIRIQFEEEQDKKSFLYIRNGTQLWRIACEHAFGSVLFPDLAHTTLTSGESLWVHKDDFTLLRTEADLAEQHGEDWQDAVEGKYEPFNETSVYYDDISNEITKMMNAYNRVAVLLQGLLDRSTVLHPHSKIRLWNTQDFDNFIVLVFDKDRAITAGEAPNFLAYRTELRKKLKVGDATIGQEHVWWNRERERVNEHRYKNYNYSHRDTIYEDNSWWWPNDKDPGPGYIAEVISIHGNKAKFKWKREGRKQRPGSDPWESNYPQIDDAIRVELEKLFNISAYTPGDFKKFFDDPRTRAEYLQWAPLLLAAEEWHAQGRHKYQPPLR